ncbi:3-methyl-2-oxobutanoate hydroxymethyltransferase [Fangia hongkongensis]|uniref:3-methyl-2-oxobutanoate hydroxymethyltransferase n=1 Tax=Fangia hongkongensis TaxID=270495 RepID=UPI00036173FF|nr:3-methyl-2-oxobutanoate hydroxymethyltransferase [Fangia hongkongensis]
MSAQGKTKHPSKLSAGMLQNLKKEHRKISMLTCYDYSFANIANQSDIDILLVGDSGIMTLFGYPDTTYGTIELMEMMTKAVVTGAPDKFIIADMPFLSHRKGIHHALDSAERLIKCGAQAVKIEGLSGHKDVIAYLIESGIPVMGHLGLTPQSVHATGYKVQGRNTDDFQAIIADAMMLQELGVFAMVLECVPTELTEKITQMLDIPVIGIGAGNASDGQVLVLQDMLGMTQNIKPKFVRHYLNGFHTIQTALNHYHQDVKNASYPDATESYHLRNNQVQGNTATKIKQLMEQLS